jgi:exosortase/archaeosortase family protein
MIKTLSASLLSEMPAQIRSFLTKALILFICWKLVYHLILFPVRIPDKQLTALTAQSTSVLYRNLLGEQNVYYKEDNRDPNFPKSAIYINNRRSIGIADPCNGLELYVLYIGFIFCIPTSIKRQTLFIATGILGIFILNSFRCFGLAWLNFHDYSIADFAHHYLFKMIIYAAIFYAWVIYSRKYFSNAG